MKNNLIASALLLIGSSTSVFGQASDFFTNFVRQVQLPSGVIWDTTVAPTGEQFSPLPINPGGARFELWTVQNDPLTVFLLDTRYVGTYVPVADVLIRTEDPYNYTGGIPRTRADRPIMIDIQISGIQTGPEFPDAAKSVELLRHVQSYGVKGTGQGIDRTQATLARRVSLVDNALHRMTYMVSSVPGADRSKLRGEERYSVFSLDDYQAPPSQLSSMFVQIWPVADGTIQGVTEGQKIRFNTPKLTFTMNDLYPDSRTYTQIYPGPPVLGTEGTVLAGSGLIIYDSVPHDRTIVLDGWADVVTESGEYTMELLTATPFGVDRLAVVTFSVNRDLSVNGAVTTME